MGAGEAYRRLSGANGGSGEGGSAPGRSRHSGKEEQGGASQETQTRQCEGHSAGPDLMPGTGLRPRLPPCDSHAGEHQHNAWYLHGRLLRGSPGNHHRSRGFRIGPISTGLPSSFAATEVVVGAIVPETKPAAARQADCLPFEEGGRHRILDARERLRSTGRATGARSASPSRRGGCSRPTKPSPAFCRACDRVFPRPGQAEAVLAGPERPSA